MGTLFVFVWVCGCCVRKKRLDVLRRAKGMFALSFNDFVEEAIHLSICALQDRTPGGALSDLCAALLEMRLVNTTSHTPKS